MTAFISQSLISCFIFANDGGVIVQEPKENVMKYKIAYTALIFLIYIFGKHIPLYGIDTSAYANESAGAEEVLMQMISGDAYRCSVFALGIFPFMISGLLIQIAMAVRNLFFKTRLSPRAMGYLSAIVTIVIAILQASVRVPQLEFSVAEEWLETARAVAGIEMITGVMLLLWLSRRNGYYGVGGRMAFGLVNILERITAIVQAYNLQRLMLPLAVSLVMMLITLIMENAEMRIPVQRVSIHNVYADKNYMAIKLNPVGVMPVMFTSAVFLLPQLFVSLMVYLFPHQAWVIWWLENMALNRPFGMMVYVLCEYLLTIGLSMLMISPRDITEQFLKSGDSIVNLHAGRETRRYLRKTVLRISFCSATVMGVCVAVPLILQMKFGMDGTLGMLPISIMMLTSFWCNIFRELESIHKYDSCKPLF